MGIALPATSATMANEVHDSEYGVMSAAQLMATQVGEVAGIQVVLTLQESLAHRAGLANVRAQPGPPAQLSDRLLGGRAHGRGRVGVRLFHRAPWGGGRGRRRRRVVPAGKAGQS